MKENITHEKINKEIKVKNETNAAGPRQSTIDFLKQFARVCGTVPGLAGGLNVIVAN